MSSPCSLTRALKLGRRVFLSFLVLIYTLLYMHVYRDRKASSEADTVRPPFPPEFSGALCTARGDVLKRAKRTAPTPSGSQ